MRKQIRYTFLLVFACWVTLVAQPPANYYSSAIGKQGAALKTALFHIIEPHTQLNYLGLSTTFRSTDFHPSGYFWDMYSDTKRSSWFGLNREHCLPKSWYGVSGGSEDASPIGSDIHNLYPSDQQVNSEKSNFPLGVAGNSPVLSQFNSRCKVGLSTFQGYSGMVFEPSDEYKGDFARTYMYMVTRYENYHNVWQSTGTASMLQRNTYPVFNPYAVKLLMDWHRKDPVSKKEIDRNNVIFTLQRNRNPFIDLPLLAEYVWGMYTADTWDGSTIEPESPGPLELQYDPALLSIKVTLNNPTKASYRVHNLSGIVIQQGNFTSTSTIALRHPYTQSEFEKGAYILTVYAGGRKKTAKLLIY